MGFYCFADGGESNGWILAIFTTNYITTTSSLNIESIRACVDEYVWPSKCFNPINIDYKTLV